MTIKQICYKVPIGEDVYSTLDPIKLNTNLLELQNNEIIHKLGIQAQPGTKFRINGNDICIGPSGIYEFYDKDLSIIDLQLLEEKEGIIIDYIIDQKEGIL